MFRKVISMMELNLAGHLKYKLANSSSFDVSKVASLQCTDYKSITNRLHHRFVPKRTCFKQCILRKKSLIYQCLYRRFILCQRSCLCLNADTDADVIANIGINLLLLLFYFKLTNNVDTASMYLCKINGNYWKINAIKVIFLKISK